VTSRTAVLVAFLSIAATLSAQDSQLASTIRVPDAAAAVKIAEPALIKVYGKREINYEKPLRAVLHDGVWNVYGTVCCPDQKGQRIGEVGKCLGGGVAAKIRPSDGKILSISHAK
jgi:NTF2 fold immunity protein